MKVRCGCGAVVDCPELSPEDAERAPVECEACWRARHERRELSGVTSFTDSES